MKLIAKVALPSMGLFYIIISWMASLMQACADERSDRADKAITDSEDVMSRAMAEEERLRGIAAREDDEAARAARMAAKLRNLVD